MYAQFNEQFAAATRQFADTAARINRLTLESAEAIVGLQLAAIEERSSATFAFLGEAAQVRDLDGAKNLLPRGAQVARENIERTLTTGQDVLGRIMRAIKTSYPDAEFLSYIGTNPLGIYVEVYTPNEEFKGLLDILDDKLGNLHIAAGVNICVVPRRKEVAVAA